MIRRLQKTSPFNPVNIDDSKILESTENETTAIPEIRENNENPFEFTGNMKEEEE